ncbi:MAG: M23 family metallopeptidase [Candidatus Melainabacteria bacterium]
MSNWIPQLYGAQQPPWASTPFGSWIMPMIAQPDQSSVGFSALPAQSTDLFQPQPLMSGIEGAALTGGADPYGLMALSQTIAQVNSELTALLPQLASLAATAGPAETILAQAEEAAPAEAASSETTSPEQPEATEPANEPTPPGEDLAPAAATGAATAVQGKDPTQTNFIIPIDKQYIVKPDDGGDFGERHIDVPGASTFHRGDDFGVDGQDGVVPIQAVADGTITVVDEQPGGAGKYITIDHGNGVTTRYFHQNRFADGMAVGKTVKQGELIGYVGSTGIGSGPHLHFEVQLDGESVDPWPYMEVALQKA